MRSLLAALSIVAASAVPVLAGDAGQAGATLEITGTLTDEGVECPAMRDAADNLYTLAGDLGSFAAGDRITITGKVAEMSTCMQGTTIDVATVRAAE